jgi:hypothetical protein
MDEPTSKWMKMVVKIKIKNKNNPKIKMWQVPLHAKPAS